MNPELTMTDWFNAEFMPCFSDLDPQSSVGVCEMSSFGATIGVAFYPNGELDKDRLIYFKHLVADRIRMLQIEATCDPIKIFVKPEPMKLEKLQQGRPRIISAVSLVDTFVDRLLFRRLFQRAVETCGQTHILVGFSPLGGNPSMLLSLLGASETYHSTDKSTWDWTVPYWLILAIRSVVRRLIVDAPDWFYDLMEKRFYCLFAFPIFQFADGQQVQQEQPGIMKSGCYGTLIFNSIGQLILDIVVALLLGIDQPLPFVMGDDQIRNITIRLEEQLEMFKRLGFKVKSTTSKVPEFVGFHFTKNSYLPAYNGKHAFALNHLTLQPEVAKATLMSYQLLYYHDESALREIRRLVRERGYVDAYVSDDRLHYISSH